MNSKLLEEVEKAYSELKEEASSRNKKESERCQTANEAPCSVCQSTEFVMKYRNVIGQVKGKVSGTFARFGGAITGYVDGKTHTDAVLSCRECENERIIVLPRYISVEDIWEEQVPFLFFSYEGELQSTRQVSDWLKEKGLEIAILLNRKIPLIDDHRSFYKYVSIDKYPKLTKAQFESIGLVRKYDLPGDWYAEESTTGWNLLMFFVFVFGILLLLSTILSV